MRHCLDSRIETGESIALIFLDTERVFDKESA